MDKLIEVKPFAHLTEAELAWAAGLIDGEGCITITKDKPRGQGISPQYKAWLIVANTYRPVIERLRSMFGLGSIQEQKWPVSNKWKDRLTWSCCSEQAKSVVEAVRPYLFIKARDADVLLEFFGVAKTMRCQDGVPPEILAERERLYCLIREGRASHGKNGRKPKVRILAENTLI